jgi:hypothetical protein
MVGKKRLNDFLCYFELETGGLFFGWYGVISGVIQVIVYIAALSLMNATVNIAQGSLDITKNMGNPNAKAANDMKDTMKVINQDLNDAKKG